MQTVFINDLPPALNGKNGLIRMHWTKRKKIKEKWIWLVREKKLTKYSGEKKVRVHFTRKSTAMMDYDNLGASFKVVGDALVKAGILVDDSPKYIDSLTLKWQKAERLDGQGVVITFFDK